MGDLCLVVAGSRGFVPPARMFDEAVAAAVEDCGGEARVAVVLHGACRGSADMAADEWAKRLGVEVQAWPAEWERLGKAAGPIRNAKMITFAAVWQRMASRDSRLLAFYDGKSAGTGGIIRLAKSQGVPVTLCEVPASTARKEAGGGE